MTRWAVRWLSGWRLLALAALLLTGAGTAGAVISSAGSGVIGPLNMIQPTGPPAAPRRDARRARQLPLRRCANARTAGSCGRVSSGRGRQ